jgi:hypothetical protein
LSLSSRDRELQGVIGIYACAETGSGEDSYIMWKTKRRVMQCDTTVKF